MSLRNNLITLLNKYFYKKAEKPFKYSEWMTSVYENGTWYLGTEFIEQEVINAEKTLVKATAPYVTGFIITLNKIFPQQEYIIDETGISSITIDENDNTISFALTSSGPYTSGLTLTLKEYYDEENDILYKGCYWSDE